MGKISDSFYISSGVNVDSTKLSNQFSTIEFMNLEIPSLSIKLFSKTFLLRKVKWSIICFTKLKCLQFIIREMRWKRSCLSYKGIMRNRLFTTIVLTHFIDIKSILPLTVIATGMIKPESILVPQKENFQAVKNIIKLHCHPIIVPVAFIAYSIFQFLNQEGILSMALSLHF